MNGQPATASPSLADDEDEVEHPSADEFWQLWGPEIDRRVADVRERLARGETVGRPAEEVFAEARVRLAEMRAARARR